MEDRCCQENRCAARHDGVVKIFQLSCSTGRHDRHVYHLRDCLRKRDVKPPLGSLTVHARWQEDAGTELLALTRPRDYVFTHGLRAARNHDLKP